MSSVQFKSGNFEGPLVFIIFTFFSFNCAVLIVVTLENSGNDVTTKPRSTYINTQIQILNLEAS